MEPEMRENEDKIAPFSRLFFRKQKAGLAPKLKPATKGGSGDQETRLDIQDLVYFYGAEWC